MSYDILFVPRAPGQTWEAALDEAEGRDVLGDALRPERLAQWDRVLATLRQRLGDLDVVVTRDTCEATHASGLVVSLYPDEASICFPYADRPDRQAFHDLVVDAVGTLERETGLHAWDAQTDAPFDGRVHDGPGLDAARRIGQEASDVSATDAMAARAEAGALGPDTGPVDLDAVSAAARPPRPALDPDTARQQRRARRYVAVGVVLVLGSFLLQGRAVSSTVVGVLLAVGVADIVLGLLMLRPARPVLTGPLHDDDAGRDGTGHDGTGRDEPGRDQTGRDEAGR